MSRYSGSGPGWGEGLRTRGARGWRRRVARQLHARRSRWRFGGGGQEIVELRVGVNSGPRITGKRARLRRPLCPVRVRATRQDGRARDLSPEHRLWRGRAGCRLRWLEQIKVGRRGRATAAQGRGVHVVGSGVQEILKRNRGS